jgi:hypothetical protein
MKVPDCEGNCFQEHLIRLSLQMPLSKVTDAVTDFGPSNPGWWDLSTMSSPEAVAVRSIAHTDILSLAAMWAAAAPDPKAKILGDAPFFVEQHQTNLNAAAFAQITGKMVLQSAGLLCSPTNVDRLAGPEPWARCPLGRHISPGTRGASSDFVP